MGSRTTGYIENVATIERECAQQVENVTLASETKCRKLEAELAIARSALAAAERDFRNEKAMLGAEVDMQKSEVNRLRCDLERRTAERDCAREEATRNEAARQQLDLDIKELRRQNNQQQREISVNQSEAVQKILEQKVAVENELNSLRDEFNKQSSRMRSLQECVTTLEHEIHDLHRMNTMLEGSLSSRQSLLVHNQDQVDKLKDELALARENLAGLTERAEQLQQELDRNRKEREVLEAFVHEQSAELVNKRDRATALEGTLARDHRAWAEKRLELEASLAALGEQRCSLTREVAELKVALSALLTQKEAADGNAAQLAFDKANLMRENTQLQHSVEFNEDRVKQMEQEAAALRKQVDNVNVDLEASRQLLGEKDARLEQLEGEFAALKEVLGDTASAEGESGKQIVTKLLSKIAALQHAAVEAEAVRRRLHNELVDLRGNIRVYCRLKPHPTPATRLGSDGASIALAVEGSEHRFSYDRVFGPDSTQEQVFGAVSDLVQSALDGFHVCVFSYGQTGAGKTHTMQGGAAPAARGIIPRALEKILATAQKLEQEAEWSYGMGACFIEVYNQTLRDLLSGGAVLQENNAIKHDPSGGHTVVAGAKVVKVHDLEGATELVRQAGEARAVVATAMNASSSRSHCVFMLNITGWHQSTGTRLLGSLCLVDLAGSERLDRSQAEGAAKKEACHINSSLSALGDVFAALSSKAQHVPYRNSKLTYLLQPCLGGNGKTLMFVNINPEPASAGESLCSLRFAAKVNGCETGAKGGARRNVQTLGGGGGSGEGEPSGSSNPAGEARRTEAAGSSARAAGPSGSNAVAPNAAQTRRPVAASQSQQPRQQQPEAKLAPRGRGIPAPTRPSGPPRPAPAVGSAAVAAAQKSQQNTASRAAQPGSARFSLGFPRLPGVDAVSAAGAKRMSLLPQRPGADAGVSRTKASTAARTGAAPVVGTGAGVKRPGSVIPDAAAKRSKS
ncbi:hypothetical protein PLESTF_000730300 [Pleodorina starrii]|nr:hypothetical protein PLESTF_000730300 [Pleodorina starrii]